MENISKPKLIFFQWYYEELPMFLRLHLQQHVKCLSEFFEVVVVNEDCDYEQICDKYQPDLTLFESGIYTGAYGGRGQRKIRNTSAHPEIPKLGFLHSDAYCSSRAAFISDMENWGIETFFTLCVSMGEYMPEIAKNLFAWPNFVDGDLYRDYGESKIIPFYFTGSQATHYPWRNQIIRIISQHYPSLNSPHFGWDGIQATSRMVYGEQYARTLNASWFVPTCGTIAKEVVRKHFEIPACKACLITEKTLALEAAGFIDMQNCVFVNESDVLDKIDYLFQNLGELESIIDAGYQLVHSRHTLKQRDSIFQWFNLYKDLKPNQKIVQTNPFEPLIVVETVSGVENSHIISSGLDRMLLWEGDEKLWDGKYKEAEALYRRCINYQGHIPEPKLRLTLCNLYKGNPDKALYWVVQPIQGTLGHDTTCAPDPVEWSYFIIALLCKGKLDEAVKCADQFRSLYHPELDRVRWVVGILENRKGKNPIPDAKSIKRRYSVHQLPDRGLHEWIDDLCIMLKACKQFRFAKILKNSVPSKHEALNKKTDLKDEEWLNDQINDSKQATSLDSVEVLALISKILEYQRTGLTRKIKVKLKILIKNFLVSKFFCGIKKSAKKLIES